MCDFITDVYKNVFDKEFSYSNFDDRIKLQKAVYLLENMGMEIGNYGFVWYKHGPYSQRLQNDAYHAERNYEEVQFSDYAQEVLTKLKNYIKVGEETQYDASGWLEAIASLDFMVTRQFMDDETALECLKSRKPHLKYDSDNKKALIIAKEIRSAVI